MARWLQYAGVAGLLLALVALFGGSLAKPRIGVLDVARVVSESTRAQRYEEELDAKYQELTKQIKEKKLTGEELKTAEEAAYTEYLKTKSELEAKLDKELNQAVAQVARRRRLALVLHKEAVRRGGVDITDSVIKSLQ